MIQAVMRQNLVFRYGKRNGTCMKTKQYTLWTLISLLPLLLSAQHKWEGTIFFGGANYQGDLVPTDYPYLEETNPAYGLALRYYLGKTWALRLGATYGELSGTDQNFDDPGFSEKRQYSFKSQVIESALLLEWEPFAKKRYSDTIPNYFNGIISPYLFAGAGLSILDAKPTFARYQNGELPPFIAADKSINYPQQNFAVPIGGGFKVDLGRRVALGLEAGTRYAFTDYIDGVSKAANPDKGDWYAFAGATLTIRFYAKDSDKDGIPDKEDRCPEIFGHITAKGCPDRDGDGVEDVEDLCPDEFGLKLLAGCPDDDNDGIANMDDTCPTEPGPEYTNGCPDTDGDKIADKDDWCALLAGPSWKGGCPLLDTNGDSEIDEAPFCNTGAHFDEKLTETWQEVALPSAVIRVSTQFIFKPIGYMQQKTEEDISE